MIYYLCNLSDDSWMFVLLILSLAKSINQIFCIDFASDTWYGDQLVSGGGGTALMLCCCTVAVVRSFYPHYECCWCCVVVVVDVLLLLMHCCCCCRDCNSVFMSAVVFTSPMQFNSITDLFPKCLGPYNKRSMSVGPLFLFLFTSAAKIHSLIFITLWHFNGWKTSLVEKNIDWVGKRSIIFINATKVRLPCLLLFRW